MMTGLAVFSIGLLLWSCYHFVRSNGSNHHTTFGLILKILSGLALGLIYKYHYGGGDTFTYFHESETIANYLIQFPGEAYAVFFDTINHSSLVDQLIYRDQPRALLFAKIVSVFYLLTGGNYWIISASLSLINFLCIHAMVVELNKNFPKYEKAAVCSFYFLPTFVFWSSGLLKESLAIGALAMVVAMALRLLRNQNYTNIFSWGILFLAGFALWELKYFYAAVAMPLLLVILARNMLERWFKVSKIHVAFMVFIGFFIVSMLHYNLSPSRILDVIYENHQLGLQASDSGIINYYHFDGSLYGFLINVPLALLSGLFRPLLFEFSNVFQGIVAVENTIVLAILLAGIWKTRFGISLQNPLVIATLMYVISLAILLAFATPNFGTLSRYKEGYWPFFVFLVLILYQKKPSRSMDFDGFRDSSFF